MPQTVAWTMLKREEKENTFWEGGVPSALARGEEAHVWTVESNVDNRAPTLRRVLHCLRGEKETDNARVA